MRRISLPLAIALLAAPLTLAPVPASAQVAVGDSLWRLGRIDDAAAAYRRALDEDRLSVRANFRLAQTLAWGSNIDSALVLLRAARVRVPDDPDLLFTEATFLSWGKRWDEALVRFDSLTNAHPGNDFDYVRVARARTLSWAGRLVEAESGYAQLLARDPANRDARFGLAQVRAWSGDLDGAAARYGELLATDPAEVRALVGLGNVRLWQQRFGAARALAERARASDSSNAEVRELQRAVRTAIAPRVEVSHDWSEDSERNTNRWQRATLRTVTRGGLRTSAAVATLHATDPFRESRRTLVEGSVGLPLGRGSLTAIVGARTLSPAPLAPGDPAPTDRTVISGRLTAQQRLRPSLGVTATLARWPFDEVAVVTPLALDITQGDLGADWRATSALTLTGNVGLLSYSDGNAKRSWSARATQRVPNGLSVGALVSGFGFDSTATGRYFSPSEFIAGEVTAGWTRESPAWIIAVGSGYGAQRVNSLPTQDQWHVDATATRQWTTGWAVELHGGRSNSAAASAAGTLATVGAYTYSTLGLSLRRTF